MVHTKPYNTLFLDRDGVINVKRKNDYVKSIEEFIFIDDALKALTLLSAVFNRIIIVTNQRGVGRGCMTLEKLNEIHNYMIKTIISYGGKIDKIYYCSEVDDRSMNRKPNIGMALQAKKDYPDIDFANSMMAGDSISDMQFANNAGIQGILIGNKYDTIELNEVKIWASYPDLISFAQDITI